MTIICGELILIRHAKAEPPGESAEDDQRKLTKTGLQDLKKILSELKNHFIAAEELQLCSSPKVRSVQTAEIIADYLGIKKIEKHDWISNGDSDGLLEKLGELKPASSLVLIGHEPYLSDWSRQLCGYAIPFRKTTAIGFRISSAEQFHAEPLWILHPDTINPDELNIRPNQPAQREFQKILRFQLQEVFQMQQKFTALPEDPETVHQLRVRIRSLRSVLSFLKPLFEQERYQIMQDQLRKLSQMVAKLRELDVLSREWTNLLEKHPVLLSQESVLTAKLKSEREKEKAKSYAAASSRMLPVVFDVWNRIESELVKTLKPFSFEEFSNKRIDNWIKKAGERLKEEGFTDLQAIHALRIQLKKLRYVLNMLNSPLHLECQATVALLKTMQDVLGEYRDIKRNLSILQGFISLRKNLDLHYESGLLSGYLLCRSEEKLTEIKEIMKLTERSFLYSKTCLQDKR